MTVHYLVGHAVFMCVTTRDGISIGKSNVSSLWPSHFVSNMLALFKCTLSTSMHMLTFDPRLLFFYLKSAASLSPKL